MTRYCRKESVEVKKQPHVRMAVRRDQCLPSAEEAVEVQNIEVEGVEWVPKSPPPSSMCGIGPPQHRLQVCFPSAEEATEYQ